MRPELNRAYYPALDGLRGLAILLVLLYHNFGYVKLFEFGWLGVDLFFVLSGFLITDILLQTKGQKNFLKNFYVRRVLRIFPIYYLCLFIFLVVMPRMSQPGSINFQYYEENQSWLWGYLQNWLYIAKQTPDGSSHLVHFWSLAVEEQFYLVWPLVVLFCRNLKQMLLVISAVLVFVLCARVGLWMKHVESVSYFNLFTFSRIDGLCIGCILSIVRHLESPFINRNMKKIAIGLVLANAAFLVVKNLLGLDIPYLGTFGYFSLAALFGILVYKIVESDNKGVIAYFNNRYLKFFGKISYSLYVFHWPLYLVVYPYVESLFRNSISASGFSSQIAGSVVCSIVAVLVSLLSYRYFESFFLRLKRFFV
jgi:peptidoglycan/LPS O-acetylase OafA/YrhL